ncbi:hypothetical protein, partial [Alistipes finegoldii]|uniref:hypothetical protein n=1 Tax=Alistipes finegoldii TaxID=214856 RepID=UPI002FE00977
AFPRLPPHPSSTSSSSRTAPGLSPPKPTKTIGKQKKPPKNPPDNQPQSGKGPPKNPAYNKNPA